MMNNDRPNAAPQPSLLLGASMLPPGSSGGEMAAVNLRYVPVERLHPDPEQPRRGVRTEGPAWEALLDSIRTLGLIQPIVAQPRPGGPRGEYQIICGERRWRACQALELRHILVRIVKHPQLIALAVETQVAENALREDLSPLDEMEACVRLVEAKGWSQAELAHKLGVTRSVVTDIFKLNRLHPEVRMEIRNRGLKWSRRQLIEVAAGDSLQEQIRRLAALTDNGEEKTPKATTSNETTKEQQRLEPTLPGRSAHRTPPTARRTPVASTSPKESDMIDRKAYVDPMQLPPFSTVQEVAKLLRLNHRTVRRWIDSGRLQVMRTQRRKGRILVPRATLLNLIAEFAA